MTRVADLPRATRGPGRGIAGTAVPARAAHQVAAGDRSDEPTADSRMRMVTMTRSARALQPIIEVWEWQMLGRCRDRSGTQFFHPDDDLGRISRRLREAAAKRICEGCPVLSECA